MNEEEKKNMENSNKKTITMCYGIKKKKLNAIDEPYNTIIIIIHFFPQILTPSNHNMQISRTADI